MNKLNSELWPRLALALASLSLLSCGIEENKRHDTIVAAQEESDSEDLAPDNYDLEGIDESQIPELKKLLGSFEKEVGWPARPRRSMNVVNTFSNETVFTAGLKFDIFGASLENTIKPKFAMNLETVVMLVRTSAGGTEPIMIETENDLKLNYQEGVGFVYFCSYTAGIETGLAWEAKLGLVGNGIANTAEIKETISVTQGSQFVNVTANDTLQSLKNNCQSIFANEVKANVIADLKSAIQAGVGFDPNSRDTPLATMARAALNGPQLNDAVYNGVTFNILQAQVNKDGDKIRVRGRVIRHRKLVGNIPTTGLSIPYDITFAGGKIIENRSSTDMREETGINLGKLLAEDVYLNNREFID